MQPTLHFLLFKNCKNGYALTSKSRIAKFFPRLSSGGFWKGRFENWAELQTYLRRDIRQSGKSDFRWSTSACFPVFIQSGINYPPKKTDLRDENWELSQEVEFFYKMVVSNIFVLSYALTYSNQLSPASLYLAVYPFFQERSLVSHAPQRESFCILVFL